VVLYACLDQMTPIVFQSRELKEQSTYLDFLRQLVILPRPPWSFCRRRGEGCKIDFVFPICKASGRVKDDAVY
jgi:hypothetical protein